MFKKFIVKPEKCPYSDAISERFYAKVFKNRQMGMFDSNYRFYRQRA